MENAFFGEIRLFAFNFNPQMWMPCNGQTLAVAANPALAAVLGYRYGGVPNVNFKLPNLQGSVVVGAGPGPGLTPRVLGANGGSSTVTLSSFPRHSHTIAVATGAGTTRVPVPTATTYIANFAYSSGPQISAPAYVPAAGGLAADTPLPSQTIGPAFASTPSAHDNHSPYLVLNYYICVNGIFPTHD